jgi:hypothetical protein
LTHSGVALIGRRSSPFLDPLPYDLAIEADVVADLDDLDFSLENYVANVAFAYPKNRRESIDVDELGER